MGDEIEFTLTDGPGWYLGLKGWYYYDGSALHGPFIEPDISRVDTEL